MNAKLFAIALSLLSINYLTTASLAQEPGKKEDIKPKEMVKDTQDKTLVDQKNSQMNAPEWMKYTVPGEEHKALDAIAGKFNYKSKFWMDAKSKPMEDSGVSETKWILNGRYLQTEFEGKMGDMVFTGMGITGYDVMRKEYQSIWIDSGSTAMWYSAGKGTKKSFETSGAGSNPMHNETNYPFRTVTKIVSNNEHTFEMYSKGKDGKEFKCMEIRYKRVK